MNENNRRTLHPLLEILIIAIVIYVINLIEGLGMTLLLTNENPQFVQSFVTVYSYISLILHLLTYSLATLLCTKVIEKRSIGALGTCLIACGVALAVSFISSMTTTFAVQFGGMKLATVSYISSFVFPILAAILITLLVNLFDHTRGTSQTASQGISCNLFVHILLLLFTFGIWQLVWIYRVTQYLNCVRDEEYRNPTTKLLLCMFIPFYTIYWTYQSAQRIDKLARSRGLNSDLAVACLILEIFIPIIPPILMQDKLNNIASN